MKRATLLIAGIFAANQANAALSWGSGAGNPSVDADATVLTASNDDFNGFFVQLIDAGANGIPDLVNPGALNGVGGDDSVVDVAWFGASSFTPTAGILASQTENGTASRTYFVRAWNAMSATAVSGTGANNFSLNDGNENQAIPQFDSLTGINTRTGKLLRYGNSANTITLPSNWDPATSNATLAFGIVTTSIPVNVIPEPTTAGLLGMGVLALRMAIRRRNA